MLEPLTFSGLDSPPLYSRWVHQPSTQTSANFQQCEKNFAAKDAKPIRTTRFVQADSSLGVHLPCFLPCSLLIESVDAFREHLTAQTCSHGADRPHRTKPFFSSPMSDITR